MTPVLADNAAPTNPAAVANTGFRLGEEQQFSDSDSDQSQTSQRSLSPTPKDGEVSKSKRRKIKERRAIAALGEELVDVLGGAFSAPNADSTAPSRPVNTDQSMVVDSESTGKKMNKRTRQNLKKVQERQAKRERDGRKHEKAEDNVLRIQTAAAERRGMTLEDYLKKRNITGGKASKAISRRQKKVENRAKAHAAKADEMDIG